MNTNEVDLSQYVLEKYKKGWVIKKLTSGGSWLAFGDEEGDEDRYDWISQHTSTPYWSVLCFASAEAAKARLIQVLKLWDEEKKEFTEKPTEIIKL